MNERDLTVSRKNRDESRANHSLKGFPLFDSSRFLIEFR